MAISVPINRLGENLLIPSNNRENKQFTISICCYYYCNAINNKTRQKLLAFGKH